MTSSINQSEVLPHTLRKNLFKMGTAFFLKTASIHSPFHCDMVVPSTKKKRTFKESPQKYEKMASWR